jgi:hypothetical protein
MAWLHSFKVEQESIIVQHPALLCVSSGKQAPSQRPTLPPSNANSTYDSRIPSERGPPVPPYEPPGPIPCWPSTYSLIPPALSVLPDAVIWTPTVIYYVLPPPPIVLPSSVRYRYHRTSADERHRVLSLGLVCLTIHTHISYRTILIDVRSSGTSIAPPSYIHRIPWYPQRVPSQHHHMHITCL